MEQEQGFVIVVGVDFGARGDDAIVEALKLCTRWPNVVLHAAYVLDPSELVEAMGEPTLAAEDKVLASAPAMLQKRIELVGSVMTPPLTPHQLHTHARIGKVVDCLRQVAIDYEADLLVVGTQGRKGLARVVRPSVAERLVRSAPCPVLVARPKYYDGLAKTPRPEAPYASGEAPAYSRPADDVELHVTTQLDTWEPAGGQPTGVRIL